MTTTMQGEVGRRLPVRTESASYMIAILDETFLNPLQISWRTSTTRSVRFSSATATMGAVVIVVHSTLLSRNTMAFESYLPKGNR